MTPEPTPSERARYFRTGIIALALMVAAFVAAGLVWLS